MEPVASISSILGLLRLVDLAESLRRQLFSIRGYGELTSRVDKRIGLLIDKLKSLEDNPSGGATWKPYAELIEEDLNSIEKELDSITSRSRVATLVSATSIRKKLRKCEGKLDSIMCNSISLESIVTTFQRTPTICQTATEPPVSSVGLDRAMPVIDFLTRSEAQSLRVVCIHGETGLGKSTLLSHVWNTEASRESPFRARALVNVGHDATEASIRGLQASILGQIEPQFRNFQTIYFGKRALTSCFERLKVANKPLFLAIDDVFSFSDVDRLLPSELDGSKLPVKSCIALTCRDIRVAKSLIAHCGLQVNNEERVLCYRPPFLTDTQSVEVFTAYAGMQQVAPENHELLGTLVPQCRGLPMALTAYGKVFKDVHKREAWRDVEKEMITLEGAAGMEVRKKLQMSYDALEQPLQALFLDMVDIYDGRPWDFVEGIVGKRLKDLEMSSLISRRVAPCNQGAMRESTFKILIFLGLDRQSNLVWMHDLTLNFGKRILNNNRTGHRRLRNRITFIFQLVKTASSNGGSRMWFLILLSCLPKMNSWRLLNRWTSVNTASIDRELVISMQHMELSLFLMWLFCLCLLIRNVRKVSNSLQLVALNGLMLCYLFLFCSS